MNDFLVRADLAPGSALRSQAYLDSQFFDEERKAVFHRSWQMVGRTELVAQPGDYFTCEVAGEPVVVVRGGDRKLRAISNVCRHRGAVLMEGEGNARALKCLHHSWSYNLKGELAGTPEFSGVCGWDKSKVRLPQFRAETFGPFVFVHLGGLRPEDPIPSLAEWLGGIPADLERRGFQLSRYKFLTRTEYLVACNWKVYVDNYLEGYADYRVDTFRYHSSQFAPLRATPVNSNSRRHVPSARMAEPLDYWLFPNCTITIHPDNLHTTRILPLGVDKTLTIFDWFQLPECTKSVAETIGFSDRVQKEGRAICERVQCGRSSRTYENGVYHFHRLLEEFLYRRG